MISSNVVSRELKKLNHAIYPDQIIALLSHWKIIFGQRGKGLHLKHEVTAVSGTRKAYLIFQKSRRYKVAKKLSSVFCVFRGNHCKS